MKKAIIVLIFVTSCTFSFVAGKHSTQIKKDFENCIDLRNVSDWFLLEDELHIVLKNGNDYILN